MAKNDEVRLTRVFHTIVAILILLCGGALLAFGIWLAATGNGSSYNLDYGDDNILNVALSARTGSIILGGFLLATGMVSLIALGKQCLGKTFRVIYILMAAVILIVLVFITVISIIILRNRDQQDVRTFVRDAWKRSVGANADVVCEIEDSFTCRGFEDNDCTLCVTGLEQACSASNTVDLCARCPDAPVRNPAVGCYSKIIDRLRNLFLPIAIVSGILSAVVLVDMMFTCCL